MAMRMRVCLGKIIFSLGVLAAGFIPAASAEEISLARHLTDPGFEAPHQATPQLNVVAGNPVNGWTATPAPANAWTSVSYVEAGGKTVGDERAALVPAEGKSYLRMFTYNSSDRLGLASPEFPLKQGSDYGVSFKVAGDSQPAMANLTLALAGADGTSYGEQKFDLLSLPAGWKTLTYRCRYDGPDQNGRLVLTANRDKGNCGVLNIDNFTAPVKDEDSVAGAEVSGIPVRLPLEKMVWGGQALPVSGTLEIPLTVNPGSYRVMVQLRASDRSGNEGDSMLGGYTFLLPESRYRFELAGHPLTMAISPRMVVGAGREADDSPVFTGWVYSEQPVVLKGGSRLTVSCAKSGGFVSRVLLLDETAWEAERLRASDQFTAPPGRGFGDAWASMLTRPEQRYPVSSLERLLLAMKIFSGSDFVKQAGGTVNLQALRAQGETLAAKVKAYVAKPVANTVAFQQEGGRLAREWRQYIAECDQVLARELKPQVEQWQRRARHVLKTANAECAAGREAIFNAEIAATYLAEGQKRLTAPVTVFTGKPEILLLTFAGNGAEFLNLAETFAKKPQTTVRFAPFAVAPDKSAVLGRPLTAPETLLLNGRWDFAPAENADKLPEQWTPVTIPNTSPIAFFNWAKISDEQWLESVFAYWSAGCIQRAWFKTDFTVPADWRGNRVVLRFEELMVYGDIFINGRFCGRHGGGLIPFEIDVTDYLVPGQVNHLLALVESNRKTARGTKLGGHNTLFGNLYPIFDQHVYTLQIGGDVQLIAKPALRIEDVYVRTSLTEHRVTVQATLVNDTKNVLNATLTQTVTREGSPVLALPVETVRLRPSEHQTVTIQASWEHPLLWGIGGDYGDPGNSYVLKSTVAAAPLQSETFTPFAFRELTLGKRDFFLNGKKMPIQGDSVMGSERNVSKMNRWTQAHANPFRKEAYINTVRLHRFAFTDAMVEPYNWSGILVEGEGPWWQIFAPPDITGETCYDDPVWLANCEEYYRTILKAHRNQPSMLLWSLENESLSAETAAPILKFRQWSEETAPHLLITNHSHAAAWDKRIPVADFHDYDLGSERLKEWTAVSAADPKPVILGEFMNGDLGRTMGSPDAGQAKAAERIMGKWLERTVKSYFKAGCAGVMPFTFTLDNGALFCMGSPSTMGPWGDLIQAKLNATGGKSYGITVPIAWPSVSGAGGMRAEKMAPCSFSADQVNFFDPTRPVATPTSVIQAYRRAFSPMPQPAIMRPPELLVQVLKNGTPVAGVNVFAVSKTSAPAGVKGDAAGKSWLLLNAPGVYTIYFTLDGKTYRRDVNLEKTFLDKAGWDYLPQLKWDVGAGQVEFIPGTDGRGVSARTAVAAPTPAAKPQTGVKDYSRLAPVSPDGFIRRWLVYGPFPNYGGRNGKDEANFNHDWLAQSGGEAVISPAPGGGEKVAFKKDEQSYWDDGSIDVAWKVYGSDQNVVNLAEAFVHPEFPGLDGALQYLFGYAACYVESDQDQSATLTIGSDDGYKIWLNHQLVAAKRVYRGCTLDNEKYPVALKKGWNLLLLKIEQDVGGYEFALRFLDGNGKPLRPALRTAPPTEQVPALAVNQWLKNWLVCGPFPNGGGRPRCAGFTTDFLAARGGETGVTPTVGDTFQAVFPEDDQAYWEKGTITVAWKALSSPTDTVDLGTALLLPGVPGLDAAPVQYVAGYVWTEFTVDQARTLDVQAFTYNGIQIWLNGKRLVGDHQHTYNRDPASQVLAPTHERDIRAKASLNAGVNRLLVKVETDYGPLGFRLRFLTP